MDAPMKSCIERFFEDSDNSAPKALCKELVGGNVTLTDIIENLGDYLTNKEHTVRARATRLIADILHELPVKFLNLKQVTLLSTFLCEKLKDHHSLQPQALYGLEALSKTEVISGEIIETVCCTIFKEVHTQSLAQAGRKSVYNILLHFLTHHLQDVQKLGTDFVYGYMQAIDSEQDPRNLILAFTCATIVVQNFPLGVFVEEMFEVISCYFPIDFTPPASDPSGITQQDLILGLRRCLAATPKFAEHCLPLLMEKLTSDLKSAKIDALQTLAVCAETYGAEKLHEFQSSFFNCIKKEVFLSGDSAVEDAGLIALQAIVKSISTGVTQSDRKKGLDGYVDEILAECKNHLLQPELMLMLSAGRLLQAAALGSQPACDHIVKVTTPLLIESFNKQSQATPRHNVILVLNNFLDCTTKFKFGDNNPILATYKDSVLTIYNQCLSENVSSVQLLAIKGIHTLVSLPTGCLLDTERSFITAKLVNKAIETNIEDHVRHECNSTLLYLLTTYPDVVQKDVFPFLFAKLQNEAMETGDNCGVDRRVILEVISEITCGSESIKLVTGVLYKLLMNAEYLDLYQSLSKCLSAISANNVSDTGAIESLSSGVEQVHTLVVTRCRCPKMYRILTEESTLKHLSAFLRIVISHLDPSIAVILQGKYTETFLNGCKTSICQCCTEQDRGMFKSHMQEFSPFNASCDSVFVCLLTAVIGSGQGKFQKDIPGIETIKDRLTEMVLEPSHSQDDVHVCKCLAALLNKQQQDESLDARVTSLYERLLTSLTSSDDKGEGHTLTALSWVTKALVLRGHKLAQQFINLLIQLLGNSKYGKKAAEGFAVIMQDYADVMSKVMHANIRLMYRQRFFIEHLPSILEGYQSAQPETKANYLKAVSYMIRDLSKTVLLPEITKIYPLLIQSLHCDDLDLQLVTMETLSDLISSAPDVIEKQIDSLLPQVLKMTTYKPSMKVRISAIKCISSLTSLRLTVLLPYRKKVVRALLPVLDDKKRKVRMEAVTARQQWILVDMKENV
ncbi:MMS19 nucleotide excision repair protein homolog [Ruditapes philippinarum]|uniref:MMS19 nucleotide excision repair protein homolog n=1 Tax=Ruditapes philippinarum TaxID=129788 RepID=UPI00295AE272|nr:MMS19 nucleotide excision repair protein homolog [Ruditapes philippinarum]